MQILINELSLHEQFNSIDDFALSLIDIIKMYQVIILNNQFEISKISNLWSFKPTTQKSLHDILKIKANDKITKFKSVLASFTQKEPFWDIDPKHLNTDEYICKCTSKKSGYSIAESCERDKLVLSFSSTNFIDNEISVCKNNNNNYSIRNFYSKDNFLDYLINNDTNYLILFCQQRFENHKVDFVTTNGNYKIEEFFNSLTSDEKASVITDVKKMILDYLDNENPLPENISKHLRDNIFELRGSLKDKIFRLLYFYGSDNTIIFTHGFIKKTQKTPSGEIDKAIRFREMHMNT